MDLFTNKMNPYRISSLLDHADDCAIMQYPDWCSCRFKCNLCHGSKQVCNICEKPGVDCLCKESELPSAMTCPACENKFKTK